MTLSSQPATPNCTTSVGRRRALAAMSIIELIGVIAIIAIVVSLVMPRIRSAMRVGGAGAMGAVDNARIDEVLFNLQAIKAAATQYAATSGSLAPRHAASGTLDNYDRVLITEGVMDKPFSARIGTRAYVRLLNVSALSASSPVNGSNGAYDLLGTGRNDITGASHIVEAVIEGLSLPDARALDVRIDGSALSSSGGDDSKGMVILRQSAPGTADLKIYLLHR